MTHPRCATAALNREATDSGERLLIPAVSAVSMRERLELLIAQPLLSSKPQKPLDIGLFDEATRNQVSLL